MFHLLADVKVNGRSEDTGTLDGMDWGKEPRIGTVDWSFVIADVAAATTQHPLCSVSFSTVNDPKGIRTPV